MNLKQRDLWCVAIDLPGSLRNSQGEVNWLCHFDTRPTKEIIMAAIEDLVDCYERRDGGGFYTRLLETITFWDEAWDKNAQIVVAGTSIGQINITKASPYFEVNPHLKKVKKAASNV